MSRRRRSLSDDDLDLWRRVARTTTPLENRPAPRLPEPPARKESTAPASHDLAPLPSFRLGEGAQGRAPAHELAPTIERSLATAPLRMDKKTFGKLKKGKLRPERKLDLHGMTLAEAHPRLNGFIRSAYADGCRLVIIVTGKGKSGRDDGGPIPVPRGVLRNQVPGWLHAPALRPFVLQVTDAHLRHGGAGAYYVYLTRGAGGSVPPGGRRDR